MREMSGEILQAGGVGMGGLACRNFTAAAALPHWHSIPPCLPKLWNTVRLLMSDCCSSCISEHTLWLKHFSIRMLLKIVMRWGWKDQKCRSAEGQSCALACRPVLVMSERQVNITTRRLLKLGQFLLIPDCKYKHGRFPGVLLHWSNSSNVNFKDGNKTEMFNVVNYRSSSSCYSKAISYITICTSFHTLKDSLSSQVVK